MTTDARAAGSPALRPAGPLAGRCLPFCGLGGQSHVQDRAGRAGVLRPERHAARSPEAADAAAGS